MLWSLPARAHDPMVAGVNRTFAAARISAASASVIQSAAAGIAQSDAVDDAVALSLEEAFGDALCPSELDPAPSPAGVASSCFVVREGLAVRRSTLAHPAPLKRIAGGANAFFTGPPPHVGQAVGPDAVMPCETSNLAPQAAQA